MIMLVKYFGIFWNCHKAYIINQSMVTETCVKLIPFFCPKVLYIYHYCFLLRFGTFTTVAFASCAICTTVAFPSGGTCTTVAFSSCGTAHVPLWLSLAVALYMYHCGIP